MQLTEAEYTALRTAYLELLTGQESARVVLPSGKRVDYHPKDLAHIANLINGYEIATGATRVRTYAKNIRRR
jgi:hypothetical protein